MYFMRNILHYMNTLQLIKLKLYSIMRKTRDCLKCYEFMRNKKLYNHT